MTNEGFELAFNWNIIKKRNLKWNINFNIAHNDSRITQIADGVPFYKGSNDAIFVQEGAYIIV